MLACLLACSNFERASLQQVVLQAPSSATAAMLYTIRFRAYLDFFGFNSNTIEHVSPFVLGFSFRQRSSFRFTVVAWSGQLGPRSLGFLPVKFGT